MTAPYPLEAWGVEMFHDGQWRLLENEVHGQHLYAAAALDYRVAEGISPKELRIVPLTITKREENPQ